MADHADAAPTDPTPAPGSTAGRARASAPTWLPDLFDSIDGRDAARFTGFLTEDARFRFGNQAPVEGRAAIQAAVAGFFDAIAACRHEIHNAWSLPGHVVVQGEVHYLRLDGRAVSVPFANVLGLDGARIRDYLIYVDATPLFAPAQGECGGRPQAPREGDSPMPSPGCSSTSSAGRGCA